MKRILFLCLMMFGILSPAFAKDVPSVIGLTPDEAAKVIEKAGYQFKKSESGVLSIESIGVVGKQNPVAGTTLKPGETVTFALSIGVWIKDFKGNAVEKVQVEISNTSVNNTFENLKIPGVVKGIVAFQEPPAHQLIDAKKGIIFGVGTGPWIAVPDLTPFSVSAATKKLQDLGLIGSVSGPGQDGSTSPGGTKGGGGSCLITPIVVSIISTVPIKGTLVFPNSSVVLNTEASLKHEKAIEAACYCQNSNGTNCILR